MDSPPWRWRWGGEVKVSVCCVLSRFPLQIEHLCVCVCVCVFVCTAYGVGGAFRCGVCGVVGLGEGTIAAKAYEYIWCEE